ncbi:MAG: hypothetical protein SVZ03_14535 [Spirochaetota bacterium]|nr:hypothetical protein [Spirochaetota bacterium]
MEVGLINASTFHQPNVVKDIMDESITNSVELPITTSNKIQIDYEKVIMDSDDVKNFLFMLVGGEIVKKESENIKGSNINSFA